MGRFDRRVAVIQRQHRLQHVQMVNAIFVQGGQRAAQEIGLFLIIAFDAYAVERLEHLMQQIGDARRR